MWGDRLLAGLALALFVSLGLAWISLIYLEQPVERILSFNPDDLGALTGRNDAARVLGLHAFGDFQLPRLWGQEVLAGSYPDPVPPYLPMSFAYGSFFSSLTPGWAVGVHQVLTIVLISGSAWLAMTGVRRSIKIVIVTLTSLITLPMLAVLDTGNIQGIVIGCLFLGIVLLQRERPGLASVALALAISFKGYPIVILVWPLALGYWAFALRTAGIAISANLFLFAVIPGGLVSNIDRYISALFSRPDQGMIDAESSLASAVIKVNQALGSPFSMQGSGPTLAELSIGLGWLLLVLLLIRSRRLPQWLDAFLALSLLQMSIPTTYNYALGWASIAAIWFGQGRLLGSSHSDANSSPSDSGLAALRWVTIAALVATLTPFGFRTFVNDAVVNVSTIASPALVFTVGVLATIHSLRRKAATV